MKRLKRVVRAHHFAGVAVVDYDAREAVDDMLDGRWQDYGQITGA